MAEKMSLRLSVFLAFLSILPAQNLSVGITAGGSVTNAFETINNSGFVSYSQKKDYVVGAMLEYHLPRSLSIEVDGLFRELHLAVAEFGSHAEPVVTWEFPVLVKYRYHLSKINPFVEAGPAFRTTGNLNAKPSHHGIAAGIGIEAHWKTLDIAPVVRYTRWARDNDLSTGPQSKSDQLELLVQISGRSHYAEHPVGAHFSIGVIAGATLLHDVASGSGPFIFISAVPNPGGGYTTIEQSGTSSIAGLTSFVAGPAAEYVLGKGFSIEADALYHPLRSSARSVLSDGTVVASFSGTNAVTWEFPVMAKYRLGARRVKPFAEVGPIFRLPQNEGGQLATHGITAGAGVEAHWKRIKIAPGIRFTHWAQQPPPVPINEIRRNQVEFLTSFTL